MKHSTVSSTISVNKHICHSFVEPHCDVNRSENLKQIAESINACRISTCAYLKASKAGDESEQDTTIVTKG